MFNLRSLTLSTLLFSVSFQSMGEVLDYQTPIQEQRDQKLREAKRDLKEVLNIFPYQISRACLSMTQDKGRFNLSGLGWLMLPGALIVDTIALPIGAVATPILAARVPYTALKNRFQARCDGEKLSAQMEILKASMIKRSEQAEELLGDRFIKSEDLLAFTLGFTAIDSVKNQGEITLAGGQTLSRKDLDTLPTSAENAYYSLSRAVKTIQRLPIQEQVEETFMKKLAERMTYESEKDAQNTTQHQHDRLSSVIESLREASRHIEKTLQLIAEEQDS